MSHLRDLQGLCAEDCQTYVRTLFLSYRGRQALAQIWYGTQTQDTAISMANSPPFLDGNLPTEVPERVEREALSWFQGFDVGNMKLESKTIREVAIPVIKPAVRQIASSCFEYKHGLDNEKASAGFLSDQIVGEKGCLSRIADWAEEFIFGGIISDGNDEVWDCSDSNTCNLLM